jgi:hypothetical protein
MIYKLPMNSTNSFQIRTIWYLYKLRLSDNIYSYFTLFYGLTNVAEFACLYKYHYIIQLSVLK